jgi:hypothetical protein
MRTHPRINLSPSTLSAGGSTSGNRVYLNVAAPVGGVAVRLKSLSPGVVSVPNSVTIPQGGTSAVFTVTSFPTGETQPVQVTADLNGIVRGDTITVLSSGVPPLRLVMAAQTISGGSTLTGHQVIAELTGARRWRSNTTDQFEP